MICQLVSKLIEKRRARKWARRLKKAEKILPFKGKRLDDLLSLIGDKRFSLFLEYLELTISEKLIIFSSIDLLDEKQRVNAIKLQQQMRGLSLAADLVEDLIRMSKEFASEKENNK